MNAERMQVERVLRVVAKYQSICFIPTLRRVSVDVVVAIQKCSQSNERNCVYLTIGANLLPKLKVTSKFVQFFYANLQVWHT